MVIFRASALIVEGDVVELRKNSDIPAACLVRVPFIRWSSYITECEFKVGFLGVLTSYGLSVIGAEVVGQGLKPRA